jgi:chromate transport protein ChrA
VPIVAVSAAAYLAILLALVIRLGERVTRQAGDWAWIVPVAVVVPVLRVPVRRWIARRAPAARPANRRA